MSVVDNLGLGTSVTVQDCDTLRAQGVDFPEWLVGTPTLIDRESMMRYVGTDALVQLTNVQPPREPPREARQPTRDPARDQREVAREPRRPDPRPSARRPPPEDEGEDDSFGFDEIREVDEDSEQSKGRITEADVNRLINERKRMDSRVQQNMQQA